MFSDFVKSFHLFNTIILSIYIFLFPKKYDIIYVSYICIIILQWIIFKNECLTSYLEKKSYNNGYTLGTLPYEHPSINDVNSTFYDSITILIGFNIFLVLYRSSDNKYIIPLFITTFILYLLHKLCILRS